MRGGAAMKARSSVQPGGYWGERGGDEKVKGG